jgi:hypothetical protein
MMLVTIRSGPVMFVWCDGRQVARVELTVGAALALVANLVAEIRRHT